MTGAAIDDQVAAAGEARPSGYRAALDALGGAQKSADGVPLYTRYVNRWLGKRVAAAASLTRLTPNQVTALSMVSTMAGLALVTTLRPSWPVAVSATALLAAGYVLDSADGQLARLTGTGGPVGEWFDHVVDAARNPLIHLAVAVALFRFSDLPAAVLLLPLAFSVVTTVRYFSQMLAAQLAGRRDEDGRAHV